MGALLPRTKAEVPLSLSISGSPQQQNVLAGGCKLGKLVKSQATSLGSKDSVSGSLSEPQGDNPKSLGDVEEPDIVGHRPYNRHNALELVIALDCGGAVVRKMLDDA